MCDALGSIPSTAKKKKETPVTFVSFVASSLILPKTFQGRQCHNFPLFVVITNLSTPVGGQTKEQLCNTMLKSSVSILVNMKKVGEEIMAA
jgi:hypothetical protein